MRPGQPSSLTTCVAGLAGTPDHSPALNTTRDILFACHTLVSTPASCNPFACRASSESNSDEALLVLSLVTVSRSAETPELETHWRAL